MEVVAARVDAPSRTGCGRRLGGRDRRPVRPGGGASTAGCQYENARSPSSSVTVVVSPGIEPHLGEGLELLRGTGHARVARRDVALHHFGAAARAGVGDVDFDGERVARRANVVADTRGAPISNVVYDRPWPNGNGDGQTRAPRTSGSPRTRLRRNAPARSRRGSCRTTGCARAGPGTWWGAARSVRSRRTARRPARSPSPGRRTTSRAPRAPRRPSPSSPATPRSPPPRCAGWRRRRAGSARPGRRGAP